MQAYRAAVADTLTPLQAAAVATGNGTALDVKGWDGVLFQFTGSSPVGTITFEGSADDGTTWVSLEAYNIASGAVSTTTTAVGDFVATCAGLSNVRARISTFSSGTFTVGARAFPGAAAAALVGSSATGSGASSVAGADTPADGHATPTNAVITSSYPELFNGTTSDRVRNNTNVILQASAAQTTTQTIADQTNFNARGLHLVVDVTVAGTGSITPKLQGKDANGIYYDILVGTAITTVSTNVLKVFPGLPAVVNAVASDVLPRTWRVIVTANNANTITYSVGAQLVV